MPLRADVPRGGGAGNPIRPLAASNSPGDVSLSARGRASCWCAGVGRVSASTSPSGSRRQHRLWQFSCAVLRMADRYRPVGFASLAVGTRHSVPSGPVGSGNGCNVSLSSSSRLLLNAVDRLDQFGSRVRRWICQDYNAKSVPLAPKHVCTVRDIRMRGRQECAVEGFLDRKSVV
jgi:hypothetical protein